MSDYTISMHEWLEFIEDEYLKTFVSQGGSSVKFAVAPDELKPDLYESLKATCKRLDFMFIQLDSAMMRAHMPQDIFFGMASQIDWRWLARRMILRLATERGYTAESIDSNAGDNIFDAIADANGIETRLVLLEMRPVIQDKVFRDPNMLRDFRAAMSQFCLGSGENALIEWLSGRTSRISGVRAFGINTPINRSTARYFIESTLYWIRYAGQAGTALLLDNSRVTVARNPKDGKRYYTKAMATENYELLREFIDDVDRLYGTMFIVLTGYDFIDEGAARSWRIYQALRTRIMDDVRDSRLVNPAASLVRLRKEDVNDDY